MPLYKLEEFYQNYREAFGGEDVKALDLYTEGGEKIGSVDRVLVDNEGRFRYLVINTGFLGFGKKILLPIGLSRIDYNAGRVFVDGLSKEQTKNLPEYKDGMAIDRNMEERVRVVYRSSDAQSNNPSTSDFNRNSYNYDQDPSLYEMNDAKHGKFKTYQDHLRSTR